MLKKVVDKLPKPNADNLKCVKNFFYIPKFVSMEDCNVLLSF